MKRLCLLLILFVYLYNLQGQSCHKALWAKAFGGNSASNAITDGGRLSDGNFAVCGSYGDAMLTLDTIVLPDSGIYHYFMAFHDTAGLVSRAKTVAWYSNSGDICVVKKITVASDNSILITGYWRGSTVHIAGNLLPAASRNRVFVARFDAALEHRWTRVSDWMSADCQANDVAVDLSNNVYVVGSFEDNAFKMDSFACPNYGGWNMWRDDAFFLKLDSSGRTVFLKNMGTPNDDGAFGVVADSAGDVIIFGHTVSSTSLFIFDNQTALPGMSNASGIFYGKFSGSDGHCLWAKIGGGYNTGSTMYVNDIALAENNDVLICGQMSGLANLYPNAFTSADENGFLARFDSNGNNLWLSVIGGQNSSESAYRLSHFNNRTAVCGALFSNQPYAGDYPIYSTLSGGSFVAFNAMYDSQGKTLWARGNNVSGSSYYNGCALIDNNGNQLLWGNFKSTQNWYPVSLTNSLSNHKLFLVRFEPFTQLTSFSMSAGPDKIATCGTSVQLSASTSPSGVTYGWWPSLGFSANASKTPSINPGMPGSYIFYAFYQGCLTTDTVAVSYSNHDITVNAGPDTSFCGGDSVQLITVCNQPTATFSWLPSYYINTITSQNPYVKPALTTQYTVTATYNGCKAVDTVRVFARGKPYIYLPKQDQYYSYWRLHLCSGDTLPVDFGSPLNTYTSPTPNILYNMNNNLADILPVQGLLKVTATSPYGCSASDSVSVIVHNNLTAPPVEGTVASRNKCPGDSVNFQVMFTNSINYNFQYSWYAGWQIDSLDGSGWHDISVWDKNYEIFNSSTGYSTYTYYSALRIYTLTSEMNGYRFRPYIHDYCSPRGYGNAATLTVGPAITAHPQHITLCEGSTDSLTVNSSTPSVTYIWEINQGNGFETFVDIPGAMTANGRVLNILSATAAIDSIYVRCRIQGCSILSEALTDSALVRVVAAPQFIFQSPGDTLCENDSTSLTAAVENPLLYNYLWYENNVPLNANTAQIWGYNTPTLHFSPVTTAQNNKTYHCKISNTQCSQGVYSAPAGFIVNSLPQLSWSGGDLNVCEGDSAQALLPPVPPGGFYSENFVSDTLFDPAGLIPAQYQVVYTYTDTLTLCSAHISRNFNVHSLPVVTWNPPPPPLCVYDPSFILIGGSPAGGTYSGTSVNAGVFYPSAAGYGNHPVTYTYSDSNSCTGFVTVDITVDNCTGNPLTENGLLTARSENGYVYFSQHNTFASGFLLKVIDMNGRILYTGCFTGNYTDKKLAGTVLSPGIYCLVFSDTLKYKVIRLFIF